MPYVYNENFLVASSLEPNALRRASFPLSRASAEDMGVASFLTVCYLNCSLHTFFGMLLDQARVTSQRRGRPSFLRMTRKTGSATSKMLNVLKTDLKNWSNDGEAGDAHLDAGGHEWMAIVPMPIPRAEGATKSPAIPAPFPKGVATLTSEEANADTDGEAGDGKASVAAARSSCKTRNARPLNRGERKE